MILSYRTVRYFLNKGQYCNLCRIRYVLPLRFFSKSFILIDLNSGSWPLCEKSVSWNTNKCLILYYFEVVVHYFTSGQRRTYLLILKRFRKLCKSCVEIYFVIIRKKKSRLRGRDFLNAFKGLSISINVIVDRRIA